MSLSFCSPGVRNYIVSRVCVCAGKSVFVCMDVRESRRRVWKEREQLTYIQCPAGIRCWVSLVLISTPVIFWSAPLPCSLSVLIVILRKGNTNLEGVVCISSKFMSV